MINRLIPEWAPQEAVLLTWPDENTDWAPWLEDVRTVYLEIIHTLNQNNTGVVLLVRSSSLQVCQSLLPNEAKVLLVVADYNDTWIRDYGFLTCDSEKGLAPIEFVFNGWGQKFDAKKDNQINRSVLAQLCRHPLTSIDLVVEGGALEINQEGQLLSTHLCLFNPKRNGDISLTNYEDTFASALGASESIILAHGHLEGDDTDGHIDTLVRYTDSQGLVIQSAFNRPEDSHFNGLNALVEECRQHFPEHKIFELPLPLVVNQNGERLPASYANFLISNNTVLCPIYQQPEDKLAIEVITQAFTGYEIKPINCLPLIQQFGSLHCISMQIPVGTLKTNIIQQLQSGVSLYENK